MSRLPDLDPAKFSPEQKKVHDAVLAGPRGKVVGPGWAVSPEYGTSTQGLPNVPRNLDWVRLAQRFPVRVQIENPDDSFRVGASAVVTILKDNVKQRVLSVSNLNQPNEYELTYTVSFSVTAGDRELLPPQEISTTRDYSFDARLLLAKGHEADILRGAMARDLADMVMRRLARL